MSAHAVTSIMVPRPTRPIWSYSCMCQRALISVTSSLVVVGPQYENVSLLPCETTPGLGRTIIGVRYIITE